jgi:hypothetical protein
MEISFVEWLGSPYHHPVIAEEQSSQCGNEGDAPKIAKAKLAFEVRRDDVYRGGSLHG